MVSVWFEGVDQLNSLTVALKSSSHAAAMKAGVVVRSSAHRIEALAKDFCPVDTGALRGSIGAEFLGYTGSGAAAVIGPTMSYGGFIEWGTSRMAPRSYMGSAADREFPDFQAAVLSLGDPLGGKP